MMAYDPKKTALYAAPNADVQIISIARSTYKLPPGKAASLAKILSEQLNDEIEIKVKGDALQVTCSAEDQQAIAHVIGLFLRKGRAPVDVPKAPMDDLSDIRGKQS
jgi:capsular polysaccharide biosynthesis protein